MEILNKKEIENFIESDKTRDLYFEKTNNFKKGLENLLTNSNIEFHVIEKRLKTVSSLQKKLNNKTSPLNSTEPFQRSIQKSREITDLSGVRVILFFLEDVRSVVNLICKKHTIDEKNSNFFLSSAEHDKFGYQSVHIIVEWESIKIEVQIRTVLQHAWAAISHQVDYKSEMKAPYQLKRKLARLSGLVEIADNEFNELKTDYSLKGLREGKRLLQEPIDYSSLSAYFINPNRFLWYIQYCEFSGVKSHEPSIQTKNSFDLKGNYKDIIECCVSLSFFKIVQLDNFLRENLIKFKKAIRLFLKYSDINSMFFSIDQRILFLFHFEMEASEFERTHNEKGYHESYSKVVCRIKAELSN
ncbi:MAG: hypothetical protein Crog4KO_06490 [Crocinitomicaceae bacterium]